MPRFFRRLAEGVFDLADLKVRTAELADFIAAARKAYGIDAPVVVGFSNGANIAAALLLTRPDVLRSAVLFAQCCRSSRSSCPNSPASRCCYFPAATIRSYRPPRASGWRHCWGGRRRSDYKALPTGHNLTQNDLNLAAQWLEHLT